MKPRFDWHLTSGIAGISNSLVLLAVLLSFPLVLHFSGVTEISPQGPQHTHAILRFCFVVSAFLWVCFIIALVGIRRRGTTTVRELVGAYWSAVDGSGALAEKPNSRNDRPRLWRWSDVFR